jgi:hypothetical protein
MKVGDVVKFSEDHIRSPGYAYVQDWIGIIIEAKTTGFHHPIDEVRIMWTACGTTQISHYDEIWWSNLGYEPFEVINENR